MPDLDPKATVPSNEEILEAVRRLVSKPFFFGELVLYISQVRERTRVCSICGVPAEFREDEGCWRHKGPLNKFHIQTFCPKYGYPIDLRIDSEHVLAARGFVQIESIASSERIKFLEAELRRATEEARK